MRSACACSVGSDLRLEDLVPMHFVGARFGAGASRGAGRWGYIDTDWVLSQALHWDRRGYGKGDEVLHS